MAIEMRVLDHGLVRITNIAGHTRRPTCVFDADDRDPAQAARMSFAKKGEEARLLEEDIRLADYLMRNWHTTPFEMIEIWCEMKLPIFVARQFVRHRTVSINEVSGRYIQLPAEWYIPSVVGGKPINAKQGQSDGLDLATQQWYKDRLSVQCRVAYDAYEEALRRGVAAEHARLLLHLNHYTHWIWKQDLHNMMHFLSLRMDSHAQVEAQVYAQAVCELLRRYLPHTMTLFDKYRRKGNN